MKTYTELKQIQQNRVNNFKHIFFAFSNEQFAEGLKKMNLEENEKVVSIGAGGYVPKKHLKEFTDMLALNEKERKDFKKDEKKLINAIAYELLNHEYIVNGDVTDALDALGLKESDVPREVLKKAIKKCLNQAEE